MKKEDPTSLGAQKWTTMRGFILLNFAYMMIWKHCPDKIVLTCPHVDVSLIHLILLLAINCAAVGKFHSFTKET